MPHRGKITATMREYKFRRGEDSEEMRAKVQQALKGYPTRCSYFCRERCSRPSSDGYPINIEITGKMLYGVNRLLPGPKCCVLINGKNIPGIDELKN